MQTTTAPAQETFETFTPPCDGIREVQTCSTPATWGLITACCGREFLKCEAHLQRIRTLAAVQGGFCRDCGHAFPPGSTAADLFAMLTRI